MASNACSQTIDIVNDRSSKYTIVIPVNSPKSVKEASIELQRCIQLASGVLIPIKDDSQSITEPYISLGINKVGKPYSEVDDDGYRIITRNKNIIIYGNDTGDGEQTSNGGTSEGTANGVYSFLEDYLDVRWLMPGDLGRDVPEKATIHVPKVDDAYNPVFKVRTLSQLQSYSTSSQKRNVTQWMSVQKLGSSYKVDYQHNWDWIRTDFPSLFKEHPDWFAYLEGKRAAPLKPVFKLETTNRGLVEFFANHAVKSLRNSKNITTFSLSPSDDRFWSESSESKKYYDPAPFGRSHDQVTRLILKWYNDVAEIVKEEYPEGKLAGYIYADYFFPPNDSFTFSENFIPVIAASPFYGYRLFSENNKKILSSTLSKWASGNPAFWMYFDMPTQLFRQDMSGSNNFPGTTANITPVGVDILDFLFPKLVEYRLGGAALYGSPSWSSSALSNYVLAKLLWNPSLKAGDLQKEWLIRAYGREAGATLLTFYNRLESLFKEYYEFDSEAGFKLTEEMLEKVYAKNYPELEKIFLKAKGQKLSSTQAERLELLAQNFRVLQWRLKAAKLLDQSYQSELSISDERISEILGEEREDFQVFPGIIPAKRLIPKMPAYEISFSKGESKNSKARTRLSSQYAKNIYMIVSAKKQKISVIPKDVEQGLLLASYVVIDKNEKLVNSGILTENRPITFEVLPNTPYYIYVPSRKNVAYKLRVQGAKQINGNFVKEQITINSTHSADGLFIQNISGASNDLLFDN